MEIIALIVVALVFLVLGGIITHLVYYRGDDRKNEENSLVSNFQYDKGHIPFYLEEWKTIIETQMHFNDLIIRFRSIVLSVFLAGVAIVFGLDFKLDLQNFDFIILTSFALIFWICCFLLDLFYYNRLLQGAVEHIKKFDDNASLKKLGFFGLTSTIISKVSALWSRNLILVFYLLPLIVLLIAILLKSYFVLGNPIQ